MCARGSWCFASVLQRTNTFTWGKTPFPVLLEESDGSFHLKVKEVVPQKGKEKACLEVSSRKCASS